MSRSTKKGYYVDPQLWDTVQKAQSHGLKKPIRTYFRRSTITPEFVGLNFEIHNGKMFHPLHVTANMVGHKLGEFSPTRTFKGHSTPTQKVQK